MFGKRAKGAVDSPAQSDGGSKFTPPRDPYSAVKQEFNEIYGDKIVQAKNWRTLAVVNGLAAVIMAGGLVYMSTKSRFIPYVVEVDKFGSVAATGLADKADIRDERILRAFLHRMVTDARRVTFDPTVQKESVNRVFTMLANNTAAQAKMSEFYSANSPFVRGQSEAVTAEVSSILRISERAWQVAWVESTRDQQGQLRNQTQWKGTFNIAFNPPTEEAQILLNPLGLFVTDFDWRQELGQ